MKTCDLCKNRHSMRFEDPCLSCRTINSLEIFSNYEESSISESDMIVTIGGNFGKISKSTLVKLFCIVKNEISNDNS